MELAVAIYQATTSFPKDEVFGLRAQMRRAASSVPANIAEGRARNHPKEYHQFLGIACGSLAELETHLELARRLGLLPIDQHLDELLAKAGKTLYGLRKSIRPHEAIPAPSP